MLREAQYLRSRRISAAEAKPESPQTEVIGHRREPSTPRVSRKREIRFAQDDTEECR
jgi:hypothetical protein